MDSGAFTIGFRSIQPDIARGAHCLSKEHVAENWSEKFNETRFSFRKWLRYRN